jgi:hypothetical protein
MLLRVLVQTEFGNDYDDRDTRRAEPVRAAFLFAFQFRKATPPGWRENTGA